MTSASIHRSNDRKIGVGFRLSPEDRDLLRALVTESGLTTQAYLETKALGRDTPIVLRNGRPPASQESLPMTG